jgi:Ca2+-binding EF-hand superfamily protein
MEENEPYPEVPAETNLQFSDEEIQNLKEIFDLFDKEN